MVDDEVSTPYTTVRPFIQAMPEWIPEEEQERVAAYAKYDEIYWCEQTAFQLAVVGEEAGPLYIPKARTVVDTTSHYLLKGLQVVVGESATELAKSVEAFIRREQFYSKFHIAKHSGVSRGDFVLHITADEEKDEGKRISVSSVHPGAYFPVYDEWDPDKLVRVHIAEVFPKKDDYGQMRNYIRRLTYEYVKVGSRRRVQRFELMLEERDWFDPKKQRVVRQLLKPELLPESITHIPVYHFKNIDWQGQDYGSSEIRGFERLLQGINQTMTDSEVALALEGIGVYATDAAPPADPETGVSLPWEIAPGKVMEVPNGSFFKRVEGVSSITPMLDHVRYLQEMLHEASGTSEVSRGQVDVQVAQSGIALAIKFMPTLAKIEERDNTGLEKLRQFWHDWKFWWAEYEGQDYTADEENIDLKIGDKLPQDRVARLNELNNMFDRKVISAKFYRQEMAALGYKFPDDMDKDIAEEQQAKFEMAQKLAMLNGGPPGSGGGSPPPAGGERGGDPQFTTKERVNRSNNAGRPNESGGSEA